MWRCAAALLLGLLASSPATAEPLVAGRWALRTEGRPLMVLELRIDPAAKGGWAGSLSRPSRFELRSGMTVANVHGPATSQPMIAAIAGADRLELSVRDRSNDVRSLIWTPAKGGGGSLKWKGFDLVPPLPFTPASRTERVPDAWDKSHVYSLLGDLPDNPEMTTIFQADQAARSDLKSIDWNKLSAADDQRRARTRQLLDSGGLRSGLDFYHAAFVFQHGRTPQDYLLAHSLAVIAAARGRPEAAWIAAATLDRYLQNIGKKQVYGTQFLTPPNGPTTQEPYDRVAIPDSVREALGVPAIAAQDEQRRAFQTQLKAAPQTP